MSPFQGWIHWCGQPRALPWAELSQAVGLQLRTCLIRVYPRPSAVQNRVSGSLPAVRRSESGVAATLCHRTPRRWRDFARPVRTPRGLGAAGSDSATPLSVAGRACDQPRPSRRCESGVAVTLCHRTPRRWRDSSSPGRTPRGFGVRQSSAALLGADGAEGRPVSSGAVRQTKAPEDWRTPRRWRDFLCPVARNHFISVHQRSSAFISVHQRPPASISVHQRSSAVQNRFPVKSALVAAWRACEDHFNPARPLRRFRSFHARTFPIGLRPHRPCQ